MALLSGTAGRVGAALLRGTELLGATPVLGGAVGMCSAMKAWAGGGMTVRPGESCMLGSGVVTGLQKEASYPFMSSGVEDGRAGAVEAVLFAL